MIFLEFFIILDFRIIHISIVWGHTLGSFVQEAPLPAKLSGLLDTLRLHLRDIHGSAKRDHPLTAFGIYDISLFIYRIFSRQVPHRARGTGCC